MKNDQSKLIILTLAMLTSWAVQAGTVGTTFTPSGTLTAGQMTEIKEAVNDNDTNVNTNATGITTNATAIGGNTTAIGNNAASIGGNTTAIGGNTTDIGGNTTDIGVNAAEIINIKTAVNDNATASRFYGDGSAGLLTISAATAWVSTPPTGNNLNFTNIVIDVGNTLTVPAGTTIRCNGTFTNNGTITVADANNGGLYNISTFPGSPNKPVGRGDARNAAGTPAGDTAGAASLIPGFGGLGIPQTVAASSFNNFKIGGGAGAGVANTFGSSGSDGGGLVKISCRGSIINNGTINAIGVSGNGGGGGGGIVILASSTSIDNDNGTINADGGAGQGNFNSSFFFIYSRGASGGGGGGIIAMVAPSITNLGTASVAGGGAGGGGLTLTQNLRSAGAGGGASGGNGGAGGSVSGSVAGAAAAGSSGYVLEITANPAFMM